jgi:hypothetical protein
MAVLGCSMLLNGDWMERIINGAEVRPGTDVGKVVE